jgi:hypothetical protein
MKLQLGFDVTDPSVSDENFAANIGLVKEFLENRKRGLDSLRYRSGTQPAPQADSTAKPTAQQLIDKYSK